MLGQTSRRAVQRLCAQPIRLKSRSKIRLPLILTEDHPSLGHKGEVVPVRRGYGRNWLIPEKKAVYATPENMELYGVAAAGAGEEAADAGMSAERAYFQEARNRLKALNLKFGRQHRPKDFGTLREGLEVSAADIWTKLVKKHGFKHLGKADFTVPETAGEGNKISRFGDYQVQVHIGDLQGEPQYAELNVMVHRWSQYHDRNAMKGYVTIPPASQKTKKYKKEKFIEEPEMWFRKIAV